MLGAIAAARLKHEAWLALLEEGSPAADVLDPTDALKKLIEAWRQDCQDGVPLLAEAG